MFNIEKCNTFLNNLINKKVTVRWQETDFNNPNPHQDRFNIIKEMKITSLRLREVDYYLELNGDFINLNPGCYDRIDFDCENTKIIKFKYEKGSISTTLSFELI